MQLQPSTWLTLITSGVCLFITGVLICISPVTPTWNNVDDTKVEVKELLQEKQELDALADDLGIDLPKGSITYSVAEQLHNDPVFQELKDEVQEEIRLQKLRNAPIRVAGAYYPEEASTESQATSSAPLLAFVVAGVGGLLVVILIAGGFALLYLRKPIVVEEELEEA